MASQIVDKIYQSDALVAAVADGQFERPLVVTNGCFDLIHAGHVHYLERARQLGAALIVLLNSDASVQRLKGADRPIMPEQQRLTVLAALASVDAVALFDEDTPAKWIDAIGPDILVKGGDWKIDQIAGASSVLARGGSVETIEFEFSSSTSNIISKIQGLA